MDLIARQKLRTLLAQEGILAASSPVFKFYGLDEAYLDVDDRIQAAIVVDGKDVGRFYADQGADTSDFYSSIAIWKDKKLPIPGGATEETTKAVWEAYFKGLLAKWLKAGPSEGPLLIFSDTANWYLEKRTDPKVGAARRFQTPKGVFRYVPTADGKGGRTGQLFFKPGKPGKPGVPSRNGLPSKPRLDLTKPIPLIADKLTLPQALKFAERYYAKLP